MVIQIGETSPANEGAPQGAPFGDPQAHETYGLTPEQLADPRQAFYEDWQAWSCREMPLEEQKSRFAAAVAIQVEQADETLAPKIKFAAEIYEWALFCEPRQVLPAGLAYSPEDAEVVDFSSKQASWAYQDALPYIHEDPRVKELVQMRAGREFSSASAEQVARGLPEYAALVALIADRPAEWQDQPLSPFKKQVAASIIENNLLASAATADAQPAKDLRQHPGLLRTYHRQIGALDDRVDRVKVSNQGKGDWRQRLRQRLAETTQANRRFIYHQDMDSCSLVEITKNKDDRGFTIAWEMADGTIEVKPISAFDLAYYLRSETRGRVDQPEYKSSYSYGAWEELVRDSFEDDLTATQALAVWNTKAADSLLMRAGFSSDDSNYRDLINRPFLVLPCAPHGERLGSWRDRSQAESAFVKTRNRAYGLQDKVAATELAEVNFGTQCELEYEKKQVVGDIRYISPPTGGYTRLIAESDKFDLNFHAIPEDGADIAVRTASVMAPEIVGYKKLGKGKGRDTGLYQYDSQADLYIPPPREEMLVDRRQLAEYIGSMGLGIMSKDLVMQPQVETITDFARYISWRTTYYKPWTEPEAEDLAEEFSNGNWGVLLDKEGRVLVQCTVAAAVAGMAIAATSDHYLETISGNILPLRNGVITGSRHRQLVQHGYNRKYIFDPTPSTDRPATPPDWRKGLFGRFPRLSLWVKRNQLPGELPQASSDTMPPSAQAPQPSIVDSIRPAQPLTKVEKTHNSRRETASALSDLESQLRQLLVLTEQQDLYKVIAQAVPAPMRPKDPLWRSMSLLRKATLADAPVDDETLSEQIRAEIRYIHGLQKADNEMLTRIGMDCPDPAMAALLLAALHRSLQAKL